MTTALYGSVCRNSWSPPVRPHHFRNFRGILQCQLACHQEGLFAALQCFLFIWRRISNPSKLGIALIGPGRLVLAFFRFLGSVTTTLVSNLGVCCAFLLASHLSPFQLTQSHPIRDSGEAHGFCMRTRD